jgi:hypothetical protein
MKDDTRKRLSELILEELGEKIKKDQSLGRKLEPFTDLPVEKVADAILKQFQYLLSSDLRDLIIHLIEQELAAEEAVHAVSKIEPVTPIEVTPTPVEPTPVEPEAPVRVEAPELQSTESIMTHFGVKELFPTEPIDITFQMDDWFYLYGFCYAPDSTGKGIPTKKLTMLGMDGINNIFLLDYGDIRFFVSKIDRDDFPPDRSGKPTLSGQKATWFKYEHEKIINTIRAEEVIVQFPFWTLIQRQDAIIKQIENRYVELLRALIDVHDATEWDVKVFVYDQHLIDLPVFADAAKEREVHREARHQVSKGRNAKVMERLMFKEKSIAQEIHSHLLLHSSKSKIDFMIRLDNAFMDDWKTILDARYTIGKDKRKVFCQTIRTLQKQHELFKIILRLTNPGVQFSFI